MAEKAYSKIFADYKKRTEKVNTFSVLFVSFFFKSTFFSYFLCAQGDKHGTFGKVGVIWLVENEISFSVKRFEHHSVTTVILEYQIVRYGPFPVNFTVVGVGNTLAVIATLNETCPNAGQLFAVFYHKGSVGYEVALAPNASDPRCI
jgi:hypothetical protein